jgi:hypothetical protein
MAAQEILILAVTQMLSGVCTAGFSTQPDPTTHLSWVRPVKDFGSLLLGDLTDPSGRVLRSDDVVELCLQEHRPNPPHVEDWVTDFIFQRPCLLRRLEGEKRARFLAAHLDKQPEEVLGSKPTRSLCLIRPDDLWASFSLDPYSHKFEARMGFALSSVHHGRANSSKGVPVTDLKWRALGRKWLGHKHNELRFNRTALCERLQIAEVFLALGLSREFQGQAWLLVIGVHVVPDYQVEIDYKNL